MRHARRDGRWAGMFLGLAMTLGGVTLLAQVPTGEGVIANRGTKVFHKPTCAVLKRTAAKNKVALSSVAEAQAQNLKPCGTCRPAENVMDPTAGTVPKGKPGARRGPAKSANDETGLTFSRDIAPILVANCAGCHGGAQPKGQLNLTSFNKMMAGGKSGKVIVPGKPDESRMIELLQSGEMPRGNNRELSEAAVSKVEAWVKAGALLDSGKDADADMKSYAATPEDLRRGELAKLSPEERDQKAEQVALERWKKASSTAKPERTSDKHVILFSNLPANRAKALLKTLEAQIASVRGLLGQPGSPALNGPEKLSVYVFNEANAYVEFARANEAREVESGTAAHGRLDVETPYLAAVDPLGGGEEKKSASKSKKDDAPGERTLSGLLVEQLASSAASTAGKPPRWLALGLGAYFAAQVEPRSPYTRTLREEAAARYRQGWPNKSQEALGGEGDLLTLKAMGFSLVEWLAATNRPVLIGFTRRMIDGGVERLDDVIREAWGPRATRGEFLDNWGGFVAVRYGAARRR